VIKNKLGTGIALTAFGGFVTFMLSKSRAPADGVLVMLIAMGPVPLAIGLGLLLWHLAPSFLEKRYGAPEIAIEPQRPRIGDDLVVVVRLVPKRDVAISLVKLSLVAEERVVEESSDGSDTVLTILDEQGREVAGRALSSGEEATFGARFPIPKIARTSPGGRVRWTVHARIAYDDSPDWTGEHDVDVIA
jgi:hypothetical protein